MTNPSKEFNVERNFQLTWNVMKGVHDLDDKLQNICSSFYDVGHQHGHADGKIAGKEFAMAQIQEKIRVLIWGY